MQEDQVKFPGVKLAGPVDFPSGQHALGNVGSWPAPGVGSGHAQECCEGWISHGVIQVTV